MSVQTNMFSTGWEWDGSGVYFDGPERPGQVGVRLREDAQPTWIPAAVAWAWADQLDAQLDADKHADTLTVSSPWGETLDLERRLVFRLAREIRQMSRYAGVEQLETDKERASRHRMLNARKRLGDYDPRERDDASLVIGSLDDVWQFFGEIRLPPGRYLTAKKLRSTLQALMRAGYVTSSLDGVYNKTRYATTAEGDAWVHGGHPAEHATAPAKEGPVDVERLRAQMDERERRLAAQDAERDQQRRS